MTAIRPALVGLVLATPAAAQSLYHAPKIELPLDHEFRHLGDLDGDGQLDAIVRAPAEWYVLRAPGTASVQQGVAIPVAFDNLGSGLGDVTGDGVPDLVVRYNLLSTLGTFGIQVHVGNGDGTFTTLPLIPSVGSVGRLVLADIDGDGVQEVVTDVVAELGGDPPAAFLEVWQLDGGVATSLPLAPWPATLRHLRAIDVDGDGRDEVAALRDQYFGAPWTEELEIIRWDAGLGPSTEAFLDLVDHPGQLTGIAVGDVDADGDLDLVATETETFGTDARVVENLGGTFAVGPLQTNLAGGTVGAAGPELADWDGDGDPDLVFSDTLYETLWIAENDGGLFERKAWVRVPESETAAGIADLRDLDGDGALDLAFGSIVLFGRGAIEPIPYPIVDAPLPSQVCCNAPLAVDVDGDGDLDLVTLEDEWMRNDGSGRGVKVPWHDVTLPEPLVLRDPSARGDFTGDGHVDLLVEYGQFINPIVQTFETLGTRLLVGGPDQSFVDGGSASDGKVVGAHLRLGRGAADADGDGDLDVFDVDGWWPNDGTGQFDPRTTDYSGLPQLLFDAEPDGDVDVLVRQVGFQATDWQLFVNDGTGQFAPGQSWFLPGSSGSEPVQLDVDRDGLDDLVFPLATPDDLDGLAWAQNLGAGAWAPVAPLLGQPGDYRSVRAGDVDGDGLVDLAATNYLGLAAYRTDVWLAAATPGTFAPGGSYYLIGDEPDLADLDGDGDAELIVDGGYEATTLDEPESGAVQQYGFGFAGGAIEPLLGASGPFAPGTPKAELVLTDGVGGGAYFVYWGFDRVELLDVPVPGAGIFISPINLIYTGVLDGAPGAPGEGSIAIDKTAWTTAIPGFTIQHQALVVGATYPLGWALSNAVTIAYGF